MPTLLIIALAGLAGQLVDGSLGMAFGVTSTTVLLSSGVAPAAASQIVHLAEIGTTLASGAAHWRFRNIDWRTVGIMAIPGAVGGFVGAVALSSLTLAAARPVISAVLVALGVVVLVRFARPRRTEHGRAPRALSRRLLSPLGLGAGIVDAMGGGGWGPITSSTLLASDRMEPRKVVGSVSASEFLVTLGASAGFLVGLGASGVRLGYAVALMAGGVVAAPLAAWAVTHLPAAALGTGVGGLIVLTNAAPLLDAAGLHGAAREALYVAIVAVWVGGMAAALRLQRRERRSAPA